MTVTLISHDASDLKCVNAARVSYNGHHAELTEGDAKLINAMVREGHGSVFEHSTFTFLVEAPIAVAREWMRHRVGHSYNEVSGRYVELTSNFEYPQPRKQQGRAMSYDFIALDASSAEEIDEIIDKSYAKSYAVYEQLVKTGIAKEVARYVLPVGLMTKFYWTCNARSLMNFISLRTGNQAMNEIRTRAEAVEHIWAEIMPVTWEAFHFNGRKAP